MAKHLFKKGEVTNSKGRPRGAKNKVPTDIVKLILGINEDLTRAKKGLLVQAKDDPVWFYEKIFAKVIPKDVNITSEVVIEIGSRLNKALKLKEKHRGE